MNTNLKRAIVGLALLFSMGMANATTYDIGTRTTYNKLVFQPKSSTPFKDIYNFTILTPSEVTGAAFNLPLNKIFNISSLCLTFQSSSCAVGNSFDMNLAVGSYSFDVTGTAIGHLGGIYLTKYHTKVLAVPEPQTWAMMLGGLGLIGFMSFRRRKYS